MISFVYYQNMGRELKFTKVIFTTSNQGDIGVGRAGNCSTDPVAAYDVQPKKRSVRFRGFVELPASEVRKNSSQHFCHHLWVHAKTRPSSAAAPGVPRCRSSETNLRRATSYGVLAFAFSQIPITVLAFPLQASRLLFNKHRRSWNNMTCKSRSSTVGRKQASLETSTQLV